MDSSGKKKKITKKSVNKSGDKKKEGSEEKKEAGKYMDEEEMLDVAEHCFIRMAETLIERGKTAR